MKQTELSPEYLAMVEESICFLNFVQEKLEKFLKKISKPRFVRKEDLYLALISASLKLFTHHLKNGDILDITNVELAAESCDEFSKSLRLLIGKVKQK